MVDKVFQAVYGAIPAKLQECVASVQTAFSGCEYQIIQLDPIADPVARCVASENLRFDLALEHPHMWWVDLDCTILKRPETMAGKPYHAIRAIPGTFAKPDTFLFYTNGCTSYYEGLIADRDKLGMSRDIYRWPAKVMRGTIDAVNTIPEECYEHLSYTRSTLGKKK